MNEIKVEIYCKQERVVVAEVETSGALDAGSIAKGMSNVDHLRCPPKNMIMDGVQLTCTRCHGALWFRAADGELFACNPGTVRAQP